MILPPRITPPIVRPEFPEAIGPRRSGQVQPNVWPGMRVLLLGVPRASYATRAAKLSLPGGRVTVLSPDRHALDRLGGRVASQGLGHLAFRVALLDRLPLLARSVDRAFLPAPLCRDQNLDGILSEIVRVLDSNGKLIIYSRGAIAGGLRSRHLHRLCQSAGLELVARTAGPLRQVLVFRRQRARRSRGMQNRLCRS